MISIDVQFEGMDLDRLADQVIEGARAGVAVAGERLLELSAARAPRDNGDLVGSASVSTPLTARGGDPEVAVVYDLPYAARLHEHPEYNFSKDSNPNAQGKYLESAAMESKDELGEIIAHQVRGI